MLLFTNSSRIATELRWPQAAAQVVLRNVGCAAHRQIRSVYNPYVRSID